MNCVEKEEVVVVVDDDAWPSLLLGILLLAILNMVGSARTA
jgi:hypothetical protein